MFKKEDLDKQVLDALTQAKTMTGGVQPLSLIERMKAIKTLEEQKRGSNSTRQNT